jgi:hypothetical protein
MYVRLLLTDDPCPLRAGAQHVESLFDFKVH